MQQPRHDKVLQGPQKQPVRGKVALPALTSRAPGYNPAALDNLGSMAVKVARTYGLSKSEVAQLLQPDTASGSFQTPGELIAKVAAGYALSALEMAQLAITVSASGAEAAPKRHDPLPDLLLLSESPADGYCSIHGFFSDEFMRMMCKNHRAYTPIRS